MKMMAHKQDTKCEDNDTEEDDHNREGESENGGEHEDGGQGQQEQDRHSQNGTRGFPLFVLISIIAPPPLHFV